MFSGAMALDTQFRKQSPPKATAAEALYTLPVASEPRTFHTVKLVARKPAEVNAFNMPFSPSQIIKYYPQPRQLRRQWRIISHPLTLST